jgi:hypothetical protein
MNMKTRDISHNYLGQFSQSTLPAALAAARFGAFLVSAAVWDDQAPAHHQAAGADSTRFS